ncbi:chitin deacetylase [Actinomortierella wolfii]|nr:chitin deacetylase [Actinomortierella wolfii]
MVKFLSSSFAIVAFIAVANAQAMTGYPKVNEVPDVNSPEVQAWLKEIDLTGAPDLPLHKGAPPACPNPPIPNECYWTCDGCAADDITKCGAPNTWGLTFDDGPSVATPPLLDFLKAQKVSATFFLIGSNVVQYPETVKRELAEGHHLASHTWSHHALTTLTNEQIVAEMKWTEKAVLEATGVRLKYMRPPYGDINNRVRFVLKKLGYIPVDWTGDEFDTKDWQMPGTPEATVVSHFTQSLDTYVKGPKTTGFYCLEHDVNDMTVKAAQKLIPLGKARNVNIANVAQCESDPTGYQSGGSAPAPGNSTSPAPKPTGGAQKPGNGTGNGNGNGNGNTGSNNATGPSVGSPNSSSSKLMTKMGLAATVVAAAGALLA